MELNSEFVIDDEDALRDLYPSTRFLAVLEELDRTCRTFIAHSPLVVLGVCDEELGVEVSPRGDAPGFVKVLDANTILIPDRTGNNRLDCMTVLVRNPQIGLFFTIPGLIESLRIKGRARISHDPALLSLCEADGKLPRSVLVVTVETAFIHCGKALNRSRVWHDDYRKSPHDWKLLRGTLENDTATDIDLA